MKTSRLRRKRILKQDAGSKDFFSGSRGIQEKEKPFFSPGMLSKQEEEVATSLRKQAEEKKDEVKSKVYKQDKEEETQAQVNKKEEEKEVSKSQAIEKQSEEEKPEQTVSSKGDEKDKEQAVNAQQEDKENISKKSSDEEEKAQGKINAKFNNASQVTPAFENALSKTKGGGNPLPDKLKKEAEGIFRMSLDRVRIHTGDDASQLCRQINAQAFTHGYDIYFSDGKYDPGTSQGKHLLMHELTHVVQQQDGDE